jgi:hypothetical protein
MKSMDQKQESHNRIRGTRQAYQPLKLVKYGHFQDVVKLSVTPEGSQIVIIDNVTS